MTENEAIKEIETSLELAEMCTPNKEREKEIKAYKIAIQALEEIQQYRTKVQNFEAIGTIEEFKALKENQHKCEDCAGCTNWLCDCSNERAKAIDEMVGGIREILECNAIYNIDCIATLAEQLKAGEKNE